MSLCPGKEDQIIYPVANRLMTGEDRLEPAREFERVEAEETGEGVHERYHALAERLAAH